MPISEPNVPEHRYYKLQNHVRLTREMMTRDLIFQDGLNLIDEAAIPNEIAGLVGTWLEPKLGFMYQTEAGVTPVTEAGQTVGMVVDRSGNGNHALQASAALRPTFGHSPSGGVRNLARYTEDLNGTGWSGAALAVGVPLTNSIKTNVVPAGMNNYAVYDQSNAVFIKSGTAYTPTADVQRLSYTFTAPAGCTTVRIYPVRNGAGSQFKYRTATVVPGSQYTFSFYYQDGGSNRVGGIQLEAGAAATNYQKATSSFGISEKGVTTLYYLDFDAVDDYMSIDAFPHSVAWTAIAATKFDAGAGTNPRICGRESVRSFLTASDELGFYANEALGTEQVTGADTTVANVSSVIVNSVSSATLRYNKGAITQAFDPDNTDTTVGLGVGASTISGGVAATRMAGLMYGLLVFNSVLTTPTLELIETYLARRAGVSV